MGIMKDLPENHGLTSRSLIDFFARIDELNLEVNSLILLQNGRMTAEYVRSPYRLDHPQLLFSLSKSITSLAVGIAIDEGLLNLEDKVISFFPNKLPHVVSSNLAAMNVHHLLSMNSGHHDNIYAAVVNERDWVKAFLSQEVEHEPGSYYRYSTHSTYMLSAIMEQATGLNLIDYLMPRLFEPLGIPRPTWETCPMGVIAGGMGLSLSTESIAKIGLLLLHKGMYAGKRIISESYIELATQEQSDNRLGAERNDSAQGYGYQFHLCRRGCYRGDGSFGQVCFVAPNEQIVIAATSSFPSMKSLQTLLDLIYEHIVDHLGNSDSVCQEDQLELHARLNRMASSAVPTIMPVPECTLHLNNRCYIMGNNPHGLKEIRFYQKDDQLELHTSYGDERDNVLAFNWFKPIHTTDVFNKDLLLHRQEVVTYAKWLDRDALELTLFYIETPYVVTYTVRFKDEDTIDFQLSINVSLNIEEYIVSGRCKR
ncbi:class C beta-lactamase-related serine hydrolase [Paenibacillus albiflavus]|uniref:Class C beta-lactamase-related serine hydrolase n=1 Tax=Paenibacillus albiflavus TaxID=2545760 RepID=A0A4R4EBD0_9BACL|nr:serine hydrolase [Paenibacillus albiflavus]TCZ76617.1 class C beta-lactamase-related serine hydrolase [Paenibacillus albiflavus]